MKIEQQKSPETPPQEDKDISQATENKKKYVPTPEDIKSAERAMNLVEKIKSDFRALLYEIAMRKLNKSDIAVKKELEKIHEYFNNLDRNSVADIQKILQRQKELYEIQDKIEECKKVFGLSE